MSSSPENPTPALRKNRVRSFFWPILLIAAGVLLLLSNLDIIPGRIWSILWRFWPVVLIAAGIDILIGRRSTVGALVSSLLILALLGGAAAAAFYAPQIPLLDGYTNNTGWKTTSITQPLEEYASAFVRIDWTSLPGELTALPENQNLLEGKIAYQGSYDLEVEKQDERINLHLNTRADGGWLFNPLPSTPGASWKIGLSPSLPLYLHLDTRSGSCQLDLRGLQLENLTLDSGSGEVSLQLPPGSYPVLLDSSSGSVQIEVPRENGVRITLDASSGAFRPADRFRLVSGDRDGDGVWESTNYAEAREKIELKIEQSSGSITVR